MPFKTWTRSLGLVLGVLLVAALLGYVGPGALFTALGSASIPVIGAAFGAYALFFVLRGVRWRLLLCRAAPAASALDAASLSAFGWLVSTFVPMKAGDVTRATVMARRERVSFAAVAGSVAVERALDVLGLATAASVGFLAVAILGRDQLPPTFAEAVAVAWVLPLFGLVGLVLVARALAPRRGRNRWFAWAARFADAAAELRQEPRRLLPLLALTLLVVAIQASVFVLLFLAFDPGAPVLLVAAVAPVFLLSFVIAIAPGHVGTYEASFVAVFSLVGFEPERLIPMSVAVHLLTVAFVTVLGSVGLALQRAPVATARPEPAEAPS